MIDKMPLLTRVSMFILLIGVFVSCAVQETPFLFLDVRDPYAEGFIAIPYSFRSESDPQPCRVVLSKRYFEEWVLVEEHERYLPADGELTYTLIEGDYSLQFSVLSERAGKRYVLSFLDETYTFSVTR